jgi:hypothetical protein
MAQVVESLPSKCKMLNSNPSIYLQLKDFNNTLTELPVRWHSFSITYELRSVFTEEWQCYKILCTNEKENQRSKLGRASSRSVS